MAENKVTDFSAGDEVRYVPMAARSDASHSSCENGIVSSTNDLYVFVRYNTSSTAAPTPPQFLIKI